MSPEELDALREQLYADGVLGEPVGVASDVDDPDPDAAAEAEHDTADGELALALELAQWGELDAADELEARARERLERLSAYRELRCRSRYSTNAAAPIRLYWSSPATPRGHAARRVVRSHSPPGDRPRSDDDEPPGQADLAEALALLVRLDGRSPVFGAVVETLTAYIDRRVSA